MALHRWPTDPAGKPAAHSIPWEQHQANLKAKQQPTAATPAAPATATQPLPVDPVFDKEIEGLGYKRNATLAGITGERTRGLAEYGFTESGFDPATQTMGALAFDPNNPLSKAALLKKTYDTARASSGQSMGSRGQLYAGAYQNQQDLLNRNQLQGEDALQKSLAAFLAANTGQSTKTQADFELDAGDADARRISRAFDNPLYNPVVDSGGVGAGAAQTSIPTAPSTPTTAKKQTTLKAGPNVKATKNTTVSKKRKGKTVTYTTSVKGP